MSFMFSLPNKSLSQSGAALCRLRCATTRQAVRQEVVGCFILQSPRAWALVVRRRERTLIFT